MRVRTPEQKAKDAAGARARRAAAKAQAPADLIAEVQTELDAADATIARLTAIAGDMAEASDLDLYRWGKAEVKARKTDPDVATPALNEIRARKATGRKTTAKPRNATGSTPISRTSKAHPLVQQVGATRKAAENHRGPGRKPEPGELETLARNYRAEGLNCYQANEVAYWVDGLKVSRSTWAPAWAAVTEGGETAVL